MELTNDGPDAGLHQTSNGRFRSRRERQYGQVGKVHHHDDDDAVESQLTWINGLRTARDWNVVVSRVALQRLVRTGTPAERLRQKTLFRLANLRAGKDFPAVQSRPDSLLGD